MKRIPAMLALFLLAGCQNSLTLEEAQALCNQKGGLLVIIYSQRITRAGVGEEIATPGECVPPGDFNLPAPPAPSAPAPAN